MTTTTLGLALLAAPAVLLIYSYLLYPLILRLLAVVRPAPASTSAGAELPRVSISVPVYNEGPQMAALLDSLLALEYPADRRQILVISDASDDGTDEVVRAYADRGIELLRMPSRSGKTAAENAAAPHLTGDVVVNTDASIRIAPDALRRLAAVFSEPTIGLASGRDVSVGRADADGNAGEAGYVGYEMSVRALETRVAGIVGASGCFYAIRSHLHRVPLPEWLSRDFASAMITRQHGFRAVSVDDAVCYVPRAPSLEREYRRKVRTMMRGMQTMAHMRHMLNPLRYGVFAWMLFSHKICRWLVPWTGLALLAGLGLLGADQSWARGVLIVLTVGIAAAGGAWAAERRTTLPRPLALAAYALAGNVAAIHAAVRAVRGARNATWDPTKRDKLPVPSLSS